MYNNNSWPTNGQGSSPYMYSPDDQRIAEYRRDAYPDILQSQPIIPYAFNATPTMPIQQPQVPGNQTYPASDPHLTVKQTNQTLSALASARRIAPEYMMTHGTTPLNPARANAHQGSYYNEPQHGQYYEDYGGSSEPSYSLRHAQTPIVPPPRPAMTHVHAKTAEGHACEYCGKAFGRPSALKIHLAIHTGERAYTCPEAGCHRKFSVRSNMSRHIRNVHQIWPEGNQGDIDSGDSGDDKNSR